MLRDGIPDSPKINNIFVPGDDTKHSVFDTVLSDTNNIYCAEEDEESDKAYSNISSEA